MVGKFYLIHREEHEATRRFKERRGERLCYTLTSMFNLEPIVEFVFTDHALMEMARRGISQEHVRSVLANPEQMEWIREARAVYQAKCTVGEPPKVYLLRVFVDVDRRPPHVVTVYRT